MRKRAEDYQVGWICALPLELAAAEGMLDGIHDPLPLPSYDQNQYTYGHIGLHNIVVACLPAGSTGTAAAAHVASHLHTSFTSLRFALLVGIGGGDSKVRLGDVAVSQPSGVLGGVVQYTFGKTEQGGLFHRTGFSNSPPPVLMAAVSKLQAKHKREDHEITRNLAQMFDRYPKMRSTFASPGKDADNLYQADYDHPKGQPDCTGCDKDKQIVRRQRPDGDVVIHYGNIASGDKVMKHGLTRDRLSDELGVICFEMEAAGLMKNYPCLVIRGICDYADSHKNKQWQDYAAAVAAAYAKELLNLITPQQVAKTARVATEIGEQEADRRYYEILPFETVESYTPRSELSIELEEKLHTIRSSHDPPCSLAVYGLGGCGKTQLVLNYVEKHKAKYDAIFWVNVEDQRTALNSYRRVAEELRLPKASEQEADLSKVWESEVVQSVFRWLREMRWGKWLVVIDNADELDWGVRNLVPKGSSGTVVVTSRHEKRASFSPGKAERLTAEEGLDLLLRDRPQDDAIPPKEHEAATSIVQVLDGLALALDLARASLDYSKHPHRALRRYFKRVSAHKDEVMGDSSLRGLRSYEKTVKTVWDVSFASVQERSEIAAKLLVFLSFLDPSSIQDELFRLASAGLYQRSTETPSDTTAFPSWLQDLTRYDDGWDDFFYESATKVLRAYSLVQAVTGEWPGVTMHSLVQWRANIDAEDQGDRTGWSYWVNEFLAAAALHFLDEPPEFRRYFAVHLRRVRAPRVEETSAWQMQNDSMWAVARVLFNEGLWSEAEQLQVEVMQARKTKLGLDHPDTLTSMNNLASTYRKLGKLDEAEQLQVEVTQAMKMKLGPDHPDTLTSMDNLASIYRNQGKLDEAEQLQVKVTQASKMKLGLNHPNTLTSMDNLALIYRNQGKLEEAEQLQVEVMQARKTKLGLDHPDTLTSMNNLALTYRGQGKREKALQLLSEARDRAQALFGNIDSRTRQYNEAIAAWIDELNQI